MPQTAHWPATRQEAQDIRNNTPPHLLDLHPCKVCNELFHSPLNSTSHRRRSFCSRQCYHRHRETMPGTRRYRSSDKGKATIKRKQTKYTQSEHGQLRHQQRQRWERLVLSLDPSQRPKPQPNLDPWPTCSTTDCQNVPSKKRARSCSSCSRQKKVANRPNTWRNAGKPCAECGTPLGRWQRKHCSTRCSRRAGARAERKRNPEKYRIRRSEQRKKSSRRRRLQKLELRAQGAFLKQCLHCDATFDSFTDKGRLKTYCTKRCESRAREYRQRARKQNAFVEVVSKKKLLKWQDGRCYHCNCKIRLDVDTLHPKSLTLDHLVPLSLAGEHSYANTVASCRNCNCAIKGVKAIGEQLKLV
jgi:hypothetical protein